MTMYDIIEKKRDRKELSKQEIDFFVENYTNGQIPDYQASALMMAIFLNGMNNEELVNLTIAMANSGEKIDLSGVNGVTVDKHSTGGVGDKTTLIVAPIVAALGCKVAKMSGKGLGFTGGTADKLEAIDGYKINIDREQFINQVNDIGISLISQSGNLTPADKKIYALRDVTATVESIPLIASSIMSKKIAAGSECIVLDVKMGSGAFMKNIEDAKLLAKTMVDIGNLANRKTLAMITNMDIPLGNAIGNILEVKESIEVLKGNGPEDLSKICKYLSAYMYMLCTGKSIEDCMNEVEEVIQNGKAFEKLKEVVKAQGGKVELIENPQNFENSKYQIEVYANESGFIKQMDTEKIGKVSVRLGAGRLQKEDKIDYTAGIILNKKTGDYINQGELLATLHTSNLENIEEVKRLYLDAIQISSENNIDYTLIYDIIQ